MFTDDLPRFQEGSHKGMIDWISSIGMWVHFIYDDLEGELPILGIIKKGTRNRNYIVTEYGACKNFDISIDGFARCALGTLIGKITRQYKFNIGQIVKDVRSGELEILEQIRMSWSCKINIRGYKYKCLVCGNEDYASEASLIHKQGCNVCCIPSQKTLKGYNDLWTTRPDMAKMLKYPEIGYTITMNSNIKQIFICPDCHSEKEITPNAIFCYGFGCVCSDKLPYTEKFITSVLKQLNASFKTQLSKSDFHWCKNYRYDFHINDGINCIIEAHGLQHYEDTSGFSRSLKEEKAIDKSKKNLQL